MERESFIKLGYYLKDNNVGGHFGSHIYCSKHYFFEISGRNGHCVVLVVTLYKFKSIFKTQIILAAC